MQTVSDYFGSLVFDDRVMRARLPEKVYKSLKKTIDEGVSLDNQVANAVAEGFSACLVCLHEKQFLPAKPIDSRFSTCYHIAHIENL